VAAHNVGCRVPAPHRRTRPMRKETMSGIWRSPERKPKVATQSPRKTTTSTPNIISGRCRPREQNSGDLLVGRRNARRRHASLTLSKMGIPLAARAATDSTVSRKRQVRPPCSRGKRSDRSRASSLVGLILRQAKLSYPPRCPFPGPSSSKRWEPVRSSEMRAHGWRQLLPPERSQWADYSAPCSRGQLALSSRPVKAHFAQMPCPLLRIALQRSVAIFLI
jgi:hypothetical protein